MKLFHIAVSLAAHATVVAAVWVAPRTLVVREKPDLTEPIVFELVEEAVLPASTESAPEVSTPDEPTSEVRPEPEVGESTIAEVEPPKKVDEPTEMSAPKDEVAEAVESDAVEERAKVMSPPVSLNRIQPRYPRSARQRNREGCVTVEFAVDVGGRVDSARVVVSSGYSDLDAAALDSVRKAKFAPATEEGAPVAAKLQLTLDFRLK